MSAARAAARTAAAGTLVLVCALAGCSGAEPERVDLPGGSDGAPSSAPGGGDGPSADPSADPSGFVPSIAPDQPPPTAGLPTTARAELRDAAGVPAPVLAAWRDYQEARSETLRSRRPTARLSRVASAAIVRALAARARTDAERGWTVSLRPLGRLDSLSVSANTARLGTCMWAPSTGYFVETTGEAAEAAGQEWVRYRTDLRRDGGRWTVVQDRPTSTTCPGGPPS